MAEFQYLTREGYDKILKELDDLKTRGRSDVSKAIAEAREKGDLSENAEYHAAKDEQGMLELKISELEQVMSNARIIDKSLLDTSHVVVFAKVTIKNLNNGAKQTYEIVSETEADLKAKKISVGSPIGRGSWARQLVISPPLKRPLVKLNLRSSKSPSDGQYLHAHRAGRNSCI
jgi:transcription elongation factor GreA